MYTCFVSRSVHSQVGWTLLHFMYDRRPSQSIREDGWDLCSMTFDWWIMAAAAKFPTCMKMYRRHEPDVRKWLYINRRACIYSPGCVDKVARVVHKTDGAYMKCKRVHPMWVWARSYPVGLDFMLHIISPRKNVHGVLYSVFIIIKFLWIYVTRPYYSGLLHWHRRMIVPMSVN